MRNKQHFHRGQRPTFKCHLCLRMTRDTGQDVNHLCEDCYEICGIDNSINDNGYKPGEAGFEQYRAELNARIAHIAKLGGNVEEVKRQNNFAFPAQDSMLFRRQAG